MSIISSLNESLNLGACYRVGNYILTQDNFIYSIYRNTLEFIIAVLIIRYTLLGIHILLERINKIPYLKLPKMKIKFPNITFDKRKIHKIDIIKWFFELTIIVIEFRLIALIQILYL